ncbi:MAG: OmpA family protein [Flavobacteriales bacterium]|nr:OmpA family protein [Flavobacteriales bacterium]
MMIVVGLQMSSCVSSKKYNELLGTSERSERRYESLLEEHGKLQQHHEAMKLDKLTLEQANSEVLARKQRELAEKELALADQEKALEDLRALQQAQRDAMAALRQEVCSALKCFSPDELQVDVREGKLYVSMSDKLLFPSGSDALNERGAMAIEMLSAVLSNSDLEIVVEGHTDNVPIHSERNRDNWDLSVHRATTVTRHMMDNGIQPERIIAGGRGEHRPVADNSVADGRKLNRRTEIVLAPKLDRLWKLTEDNSNGRTASR